VLFKSWWSGEYDSEVDGLSDRDVSIDHYCYRRVGDAWEATGSGGGVAGPEADPLAALDVPPDFAAIGGSFTDNEIEGVTGIVGTAGAIAKRYGAEEVDRAAKVAGREILLASIISFIGIALVAPLALIVVIRRFERDLRALEAAASHLEDRTVVAAPTGSAFDSAIGNLRTSLRDANVALDDLRAKLDSVPP
jgi:hypothetical protein